MIVCGTMFANYKYLNNIITSMRMWLDYNGDDVIVFKLLESRLARMDSIR